MQIFLNGQKFPFVYEIDDCFIGFAGEFSKRGEFHYVGRTTGFGLNWTSGTEDYSSSQ